MQRDPKQEQLVRKAQAGDRQAFAELFRQHRSIVVAVAYRMLGPNGDLDDVVQEAFLQVHRSLPAFRGQAKFSTWLHRIAVNVVLMQRRRARSRPVLRFEDRPIEDDERSEAGPDAELDRRRRLHAFRTLVDQLSEKKRTVYVLHEVEGMAPIDIAKVVDCPVLTVRTRLFYARKQLAQWMQKDPLLKEFSDGLSRGKAKKDAASNSPKSVANQSESKGE